jgi:glycosyltransferase involved in cell wall biosynthesis
MQIIHIGRYRPDSANGVDKTVVGLCSALAGRGISVEIWTPCRTRTAKPTPTKVNPFLTVVELPVFGNPIAGVLGLVPQATKKFLLSKKQSISLLHLHSVFTPHNLLFSQLLDQPTIVTPNGGYMPEVLNGKNALLKKLWMAALERRLVDRSAALHAVSHPEQEWLKSYFKHPNVCFIPNAVDFPQNATAMFSPRIAFLGRYAIEQKGLDLLLKAWGQSTALNTNWRLELAGADFRKGFAWTQREVSRLGLAQSVHVCGPLFSSDKTDFFLKGGVFVHTSRWEGMPFAVLEAMSYGLPVLLTPGTNMVEDVLRYDAGWVANANPESISEKINEIAAIDKAAWKTKSANARRLVQERFTWPCVADQMINLYRTIIKGN